jgi:hypothetical protein
MVGMMQETKLPVAGSIGAKASGSATDLPRELDPLKRVPHWVVWSLEKRNSKQTKVPYQVNGLLASSKDPGTWSTFEEVSKVADRFAGVGFCLQGSDIAAFDIDNCRDPNSGEVHPWAQALVERAGSYAEVTPSGRGLRILGYASGPEVHRKLKATDKVSCEIYRRATRYITVTGKIYHRAPLADIDAVIDATLAELAPPTDSTKTENTSSEPKGNEIPAALLDLLHVQGSGGHQSRSELLYKFIKGALRVRISDDVIIAECLIARPSCGIHEHVKENGGDRSGARDDDSQVQYRSERRPHAERASRRGIGSLQNSSSRSCLGTRSRRPSCTAHRI